MKAKNPLVTPQRRPAKKSKVHPALWDLVLTDMYDRDQFGTKKYGTRLQPHNNRDAITDLYQELLDAVVYMRQVIYERDGK